MIIIPPFRQNEPNISVILGLDSEMKQERLLTIKVLKAFHEKNKGGVTEHEICTETEGGIEGGSQKYLFLVLLMVFSCNSN